jgi:uncharacterized protein (TIGR00297 family)
LLTLRFFLGLVFSSFIGFAGYRQGALTISGVVGAVVVGTLIVGFGGWAWGLLLVAFFVSSSLLSLYRRADKGAVSDKFAKGHRRDLAQTLANGGLGALLALAYSLSPHPTLLAAFVGAMATVNSDTWATEVGVLSRQIPRLVTTGRAVPPGTAGGVTRDGSLAALTGGLFIGLCAFLFVAGERLALGQPVAIEMVWPLLLIGGVSGLAGAFFDSLLGASVQRIYYCQVCNTETEQAVHRCGSLSHPLRGWGWLDNDMVNFISSGVGALVAVGLAHSESLLFCGIIGSITDALRQGVTGCPTC